MSKIRNTLGATPDDPCGPFSNEFNILSGCTKAYVQSWIDTGNLIDQRLGQVKQRPNIVAWRVNWSALVATLLSKSVFDPTGMNWGGGFAVMSSDSDARKAASMVVDGAALLEDAGEKLPASVDADLFSEAGDALSSLDLLGWGLATGLTIAVIGGVVYWWKTA